MICITVGGHNNVANDNFSAIGSWETIFWVDEDPTQGLPKMKLANFTDPPKPPKWVQSSLWRAILDPKILEKFQSQIDTEAKMGQKSRAGVSETSFTFICTIFMIFEVGRNFCGSGRLFENLTCGVKNFQKSKIFKNLKKHHFSTFVVFLLFFGQSGPSCPHLPNFASQKFLGAQGVPCQNWKNSKKINIT